MADRKIAGVRQPVVPKDSDMPEEVKRAALDIHVEKGSYAHAMSRGISLTSLLEQLDPSKPEDHLDAFERQLVKSGIKIKGEGSDFVERFFSTSDSSVLFPEFVARQVRSGQQMVSYLKDIVATRTKIDDNSYKTLYMTDTEAGSVAADRSLKRTSEFGDLPRVRIRTAEHTLSIVKYGRYLEASYEALRRKKLDVVSVFLQALGLQIEKDKFIEALGVIINGDGNSNPAGVISTTAAGAFAYDDLLKLLMAFYGSGYQLTTLIALPARVRTILNMSQFSNALVAGLDTMKTGELPKPFGATMIPDPSGSTPQNYVIGMDKRFAIEEVYETELITEHEKIISQQFEGTAITEVVGYGKLMQDCCKVLKQG